MSGKLYDLKEHWMLIISLMLVASILRAPITAVGPVVDQIKASLQISNTVAGLLTTIPLLIFGIASPIIPKLVRKYSINLIIFYSLIFILCGLVIRNLSSVEWFILGTIIIGLGIAVGNVTIPSYVKLKFPLHIGLVTGLYGAVMNGMAGVGGGLSFPLSEVSRYDYKLSLSIWLILALLAIVFWIKQLKAPTYHTKGVDENTPTLTVKDITKSRIAWGLALSFGLQSMIFYSVVAWVPTILVAQGLTFKTAGYYFMFAQFIQVPIAFIFPQFVESVKNKRIPVIIIFICFITGFSLMFVQQNIVLLIAMLLIGSSAGSAFSTCMVLFSLKANTYDGSMMLSGFSQSVGYIIAASGPLLMGMIQDHIQNEIVNIYIFILLSIMVFITLMIATEDKTIEETIFTKR
ncbi:CynX/NimT family MFS transporter [Nosocomiicoccus massiliensis]|uniref:MFS transporter n=1 Tax=Nosocomiicoccus massiliensis TaxID=1232430 RepID=A0AAF0YM97_9STAP|nr:MFS transporter [Nosocomiicoccus massiliensis]WOS96344.1 MFS transporter [Nosocomiicoccus massiliensis]